MNAFLPFESPASELTPPFLRHPHEVRRAATNSVLWWFPIIADPGPPGSRNPSPVTDPSRRPPLPSRCISIDSCASFSARKSTVLRENRKLSRAHTPTMLCSTIFTSPDQGRKWTVPVTKASMILLGERNGGSASPPLSYILTFFCPLPPPLKTSVWHSVQNATRGFQFPQRHVNVKSRHSEGTGYKWPQNVPASHVNILDHGADKSSLLYLRSSLSSSGNVSSTILPNAVRRTVHVAGRDDVNGHNSPANHIQDQVRR